MNNEEFKDYVPHFQVLTAYKQYWTTRYMEKTFHGGECGRRLRKEGLNINNHLPKTTPHTFHLPTVGGRY